MNKPQKRKEEILETMRRLNRPIWAGDYSDNEVERTLYRIAFRTLESEGKIKKRPGAINERAYYFFTLRYERKGSD